ncbi:CRISPR-associated protein Cas3 [Clostridium novyi A str. 4570]|uniref:CRISPR-associated protein Cas3 n=1 Tax=Clostridium novyi A str. 4570 TaxID=1444290 RepID=A0AA88ZM80_CLONO|nr:CRISPR-associated helicase/endonuclease Cas3 [Clostridium novyi]KGN02066.1 CRISPR-associated protein Cas3 [Clostridium novyi A str. 4570]
MYFDKSNKFNIEKYINNSDKIYAHTMDDYKKVETLKEHLERSIKYFYKLVENKNLDNIFLKFETKLCKEFSDKEKSLFREMIVNTIYMHDLGKININFQTIKMKNKYFKDKKDIECSNSNHSCLSSLIYMNYYYKKIKSDIELINKENKKKLRLFMVLNAYVISKHHTGLDKLDDFRYKFTKDKEGERLCSSELCIFEDMYNEVIEFTNNKYKILGKLFKLAEKTLEEYEKEEKNISVLFYIYVRLMLSTLLMCDYYATSEFENCSEVKGFNDIEDIHDFYDTFNSTSINKDTREYEKSEYGLKEDFSNVDDINVLRKELFLDAEKELLRNLDKNIFYLEAPTGSGKSNVAFNLTFKLIEKQKDLKKLIYVYPFNTLVEQNTRTIEKIFNNQEDILDSMAVINSITPIKVKNKDSDENTKDYNKSLLDRQFLNYPMILTTHVSLFNYFFGISKEDLFPLVKLCNSVIVLDEIQSYKNYIWKEIITFLNYYSELLNIKFIIMSATLPKLDVLIDGESNSVNLILNREKYFKNRLFKDRVKLDYSLIDLELNDKHEKLEKILNHVIEQANSSNKNILIEFINKNTAVDFYEMLKDYKYEYGLGNADKRDIELITGDDNSIDRNIIINKINKEKNIILVATQVIEAGVDIDMDIGYKDISMLDCDEQFLGRINRSCLKESGIVYFFNIDSAGGIYKNDYRKQKQLTLMSEKFDTRKWLENKEFDKFYEYVLEVINKNANDEYKEGSMVNFIEKIVSKLNFIDVSKRMKLIDDDKMESSVFLSREIQLEGGEVLKGKEVWNSYKELLKDNEMDYAERKVKLSKVVSYMNYFIYKVKKCNFNYTEYIGEIFYIEDGEEFFTNGKFDRKKFESINLDIC